MEKMRQVNFYARCELALNEQHTMPMWQIQRFEQLRACPMFSHTIIAPHKGRRIEIYCTVFSVHNCIFVGRYVLLICGCVKKYEMSVVAFRSYRVMEGS